MGMNISSGWKMTCIEICHVVLLYSKFSVVADLTCEKEDGGKAKVSDVM